MTGETEDLLSAERAPEDLLSAEKVVEGRRFARLRALLGRNRALWITALVASAALIVGVASGWALTRAQASTAAREPGLITAPVAFGELRNELTIRGEVAYADAVEVTLDTSAFEGAAVVTGQVPAVGAEFQPLSLALEVAGRPVIVLPGELPAYRTLRFGMSGPDVAQLKTALRAVGIDGGDPADGSYDAATAGAVAELYARIGYSVPTGDEVDDEAVAAAEDAAESARQALRSAQNDLALVSAGPSAAERRAADNAVASAERELAAARTATPADPLVIANLEDALALAQLQRDDVLAGDDTGAPAIAVQSAQAALDSADETLARTRERALPVLPVSEVLFLTELPRRVDAVTASRGTAPEGPVMTVSGARVSLTGSVSEQDAALLEVDAEAFFPLPDGTEHRATVASVSEEEGDTGRWRVELAPDELTPDQVTRLQGQNVAVRIPIAASDGEVLSVPAAALTSGPGGETRVEVVEGDPREGARARTRLVVVKTGLATADGVEIRAAEGEIVADERVVVGR